MDKDPAREAITLALEGSWEKAVEVNLQILKKDKEDIDAMNRLARAYAETGDMVKARKTAQDTLKIDPFNPIAAKSLEKWKGLKKGETYNSKPSSPQTYLEEPGKTKIATLLHPGSPKLLAKLDSGDEVKLDSHSHRVCVNTQDAKYIGRLPDDLSARLKKLIKYGNTYTAFIKSINKEEVKVFLRETKRVKELENIPSFPSEKIDYISFTPPELVHDKNEIMKDIPNDEDE